jgi:hypothetical protein
MLETRKAVRRSIVSSQDWSLGLLPPESQLHRTPMRRAQGIQ